MDEPHARYSVGRTYLALDRASELIDDPCCFALRFFDFWFPADVHLLGCAFMASDTLRVALQRLVRYLRVVEEGVLLHLEEADDGVVVSYFKDNPLAVNEAVLEATVWSFVFKICRTASGREIKARSAALKDALPGCDRAYEQLFGCRVAMERSTSAVVFARADIDRPLPAPNKAIARHGDEVLSQTLDELGSDDILARVKSVICDQLPSGSPTDEAVGKALFMSSRTLRRRLADANTTYTRVLDDVRRELAEGYLREHRMPLTEITFLLGFSELAAFSRAFRRWTGESPRGYRERRKGLG
jgi:AraC-like DNA-binding protein